MIRCITSVCLFVLLGNVLGFGNGAQLVTHREISGRIINGKNATVGQFPWQVLLVVTSDDKLEFCGGSIIGEEWVLTAAHCVDGAINATVAVGLIDLNFVPLQVVSTEFTIHEEYNATTVANDIALIKLPIPLGSNELVAPIALSSDPLEGGEEVTVSGFGLTSDDTGELVHQFLNYITMTTITNSECAETYGDLILDDMVCTAAGSDPLTSACHGDSGGPAVLNAETDPVLVGVASFVSNQGCETGYPTGFTRVSFYRDWITEKTGI